MIAAPGLVTAIPEQTPLSHQPSKGLSGKAAAAHAARKPSEPRTQGASIAALLMRPRTPDRASLQPAGAPDDFLDRPLGPAVLGLELARGVSRPMVQADR